MDEREKETPPRVTIEDAIARFVRHSKQSGHSPATMRQYWTWTAGLGRWLAVRGIHHLKDVTREHLQDHIESRAAQLSPSSIALLYRVLKLFFAWAVEDAEILTKSPMRKVARRRAPKGVPHPLGERPRHALLTFNPKNAQEAQLKVLLQFLMGTGARISEACSVTLGAIDWETRSIAIVGKGGNIDPLRFAEDLEEILRAFLAGPRRQLREAQLEWARNPTWPYPKGWTPPSPESLQPRRRGRPRKALALDESAEPLFLGRVAKLEPGVVRLALRRLADRLSISGRLPINGTTNRFRAAVSPHSLRHLFGTRILGLTDNLKLTQKALRHKRITSTEIYTEVDDPKLREAIASVAVRVEPPPVRESPAVPVQPRWPAPVRWLPNDKAPRSREDRGAVGGPPDPPEAA